MNVAQSGLQKADEKESPQFVRLSLAAAMTLGFVPGWFYRNARLRCVNLLLTYAEGCSANCAFCGIAAEKKSPPASHRFIRVPWKVFAFGQVLEAIKKCPDYVSRVCIAMITHPRSTRDVLTMCSRVVGETGKSVSLLISPTIMHRDDLLAMKDAGADRIGVAIDAATQEIFHRLRGRPVGGPHRWEKYWKIYEQSLEIFGEGRAGVHLICGLGETEKELVAAMSRAHAMGGGTHLFSFCPERGSAMENDAPPPMGTYRRIQLARWLIDNDMATMGTMIFDEAGRIRQFGISEISKGEITKTGEAFQTSGCPGPDGRVACNRPYGNEKPGEYIRNFPFPPEEEDLRRISEELAYYRSAD